ncbi:hypothetical protein FRC09_002676, partial [Ceratobasidium sp. 395]
MKSMLGMAVEEGRKVCEEREKELSERERKIREEEEEFGARRVELAEDRRQFMEDSLKVDSLVAKLTSVVERSEKDRSEWVEVRRNGAGGGVGGGAVSGHAPVVLPVDVNQYRGTGTVQGVS